MRRLLQVRMLIVLLALALIPAATLPFAERLRSEWIRFWEPAEEMELVETLDDDILIRLSIPTVTEIDSQQFEYGRLTVPTEPLVGLPDA